MHHLVLLSSLLVPSLQALVIPPVPAQLVILRSTNPHAHMLQRMESYFEDMKHVPGKCAFLISVDTTNYDKVQQIKKNVPDAKIHIYDKVAVERSYQTAQQKRWTGWTWHMEPINLAVKYAVDSFGISFDYVWMMEDDVLICGGIANMMALFAGNHADLIGGWPGDGRVEGWPHGSKGTPQFLNKYPASQRRHGYEQMMRFSKRFLDRVHELAYADGVSAVSEMLSYTVAFNENFKSDNGLAALYGKMNWTHQITIDEAIRLCNESAEESKITINHPDKNRLLAEKVVVFDPVGIH